MSDKTRLARMTFIIYWKHGERRQEHVKTDKRYDREKEKGNIRGREWGR